MNARGVFGRRIVIKPYGSIREEETGELDTLQGPDIVKYI
jgi:hypothetical protein